jgi:SAM-dependent methyltransferase
MPLADALRAKTSAYEEVSRLIALRGVTIVHPADADRRRSRSGRAVAEVACHPYTAARPMAETVIDGTEDVRRYYDENTERFERYGQGRGTGAIHRAVHGRGVQNEQQAFEFLDKLVLIELLGISTAFPEPLHVLDLGCGVGASLIYLAERAPIVATGVTLSRVQVTSARRRIERAGLTERVRCVEADFTALPADVRPSELAFSIEAFVHASDPAAYFRSAAQKVVPGGLLVICDDFASARAVSPLAAGESQTLDDVRRHWLARSLVSVEDATTIAAHHGFALVSDRDLTSHLELARPRDRVIAALVALGKRLALGGYRFRSFVGGHALQQGLLRGLLEFHALVFRRVGSER